MANRPPSLVPRTPAPKRFNPKHSFYGTAVWKAQRERVKKRDRYQCTRPDCRTPNKGRGGRLIVNHDPPYGSPAYTGSDAECFTQCAPCDNRWHAEKGHKAHAE